MRFSSAFLTVVVGLVGTACAAPMDVFGTDSLDARGLPLGSGAPSGPLELPITYKLAALPAQIKPPKADIEKTVLALIDAAAEHFKELKDAKASNRKIELQPTNGWRAKANYVEFQFELPECGGKPCEAKVKMVGTEPEGKITSSDGRVLFTKGK